MEPNDIDGATSRTGYKLFRDAVEGYKQLAIAAGFKENPYYFLSNTEQAKKDLGDAVIKAISDSSTGGGRGAMLTMVEKLGQTVAAALMTTATAHSYKTGAGNRDAYDILRARYAGKLAEAQATLDNANDMLGGRQFSPNTSIAWVLAGQSAIANAFETAANGEMGASEALAQATGARYANLPKPSTGYTGKSPAYEATVEVEPSQINGLTHFTFRHFYRVFGCVDKLSGSKTNDKQLDYLVMALDQGRPPILSSAIEAISPEFFQPLLNEQKRPTGRIQANEMDDAKVRAILNHAIANVCSDIPTAIEAREQLIDALSILDEGLFKKIALVVAGMNGKESASNATVETPMGSMELIMPIGESGTVGASAIGRGEQEKGYVRSKGVEYSKKIFNNGVTRGKNGATVNLDIFGTDETIPINDTQTLDDYTYQRIIPMACNDARVGWFICKGLAAFTYEVGEGQLEQDASLNDPNAPKFDARLPKTEIAEGGDRAQAMADANSNARFTKAAESVTKAYPMFKPSVPQLAAFKEGIREALSSNDPNVATRFKRNLGVASTVLGQLLGTYKRFRRDVAEAFMPGSRSGDTTHVITTGKMSRVIRTIPQGAIIDMLTGAGGETSEMLIREKSLQDAKTDLVSTWATTGGYDVVRRGIKEVDDKLYDVTALLYGKNGATGIARSIASAYLNAATAPNSGISQEDFINGVGIEKYRDQIRLLLTRYSKTLDLVGDDTFPDALLDVLEAAAAGDNAACAKLVRGSTGWYDDKYCNEVYATARNQFNDWCMQMQFDKLGDDAPYKKALDALDSFYDGVADALYSRYDNILGSDAVKTVYSAIMHGAEKATAVKEPDDESSAKNEDKKDTVSVAQVLSDMSDLYTFTKVVDMAATAVNVAPTGKDTGTKAVAFAGGKKPGVGAGFEPGSLDRAENGEDGEAAINSIIDNATPDSMVSDSLESDRADLADAAGVGELRMVIDRAKNDPAGTRYADMVVSAIRKYDDAHAHMEQVDALANASKTISSPDLIISTSKGLIADKLIDIIGGGIVRAGVTSGYRTAHGDITMDKVQNAPPFQAIVSALQNAQDYNENLSRAINFPASNRVSEVITAALADMSRKGSVVEASLVACSLINEVDQIVNSVVGDDLSVKAAFVIASRRGAMKSITAANGVNDPNSDDAPAVTTEVASSSPEDDDIVDSYARLVSLPAELNPYRRFKDNASASAKLMHDTIPGKLKGTIGTNADDAVHRALRQFNTAMQHRVRTDSGVRELAAQLGHLLGYVPQDTSDLDSMLDTIVNKQDRSKTGDPTVKAFMGVAGNGLASALLNDIYDDERKEGAKDYLATRADLKNLVAGRGLHLYSKNMALEPYRDAEGNLTTHSRGFYNTKVKQSKTTVTTDPVTGKETKVTTPVLTNFDAAGQPTSVSTPMTLGDVARACGFQDKGFDDIKTPEEITDAVSYDFIRQFRETIAKKMIDISVHAGYTPYTNKFQTTWVPRRNKSADEIKKTITNEIMPLVSNGELPLADLIFVLHPDVELFSVGLAMKNAAIQAADSVKGDATASSNAAVGAGLRQARADQIMKVMSELPNGMSKGDFTGLASRYYSDYSERDEIRHKFPRVNAVLSKLAELELVDPNNATRDIDEIAETYFGFNEAVGKFMADIAPGDNVKRQVAAKHIKQLFAELGDRKPAEVKKTLLSFVLPAKEPDRATKTSAMFKALRGSDPKMAALVGLLYNHAGRRFDEDYGKLVKVACEAYYGTKVDVNSAEYTPNEHQVELSNMGAVEGRNIIDRADDFGIQLGTEEAPNAPEVTIDGEQTLVNNVADMAKVYAAIRDSSDRKSARAAVKQVLVEILTRRLEGYRVNLSSKDGQTVASIYDKKKPFEAVVPPSAIKEIYRIAAQNPKSTQEVVRKAVINAIQGAASDTGTPVIPKVTPVPLPAGRAIKNDYERAMYNKLLAEEEAKNPEKFKDHRPIDPTLDETLIAKAERLTEKEQESAKRNAAKLPEFNARVDALNKQLVDELLAKKPDAFEEKPYLKNQLYNQARERVRAEMNKEGA